MLRCQHAAERAHNRLHRVMSTGDENGGTVTSRVASPYRSHSPRRSSFLGASRNAKVPEVQGGPVTPGKASREQSIHGHAHRKSVREPAEP